MNNELVRLNRATYSSRDLDRLILADIQLAISKEPALLVGANGAGKSTLLKLISGLISPTSGTVENKCRIVYLPQHFIPISRYSCEEYLRYAAWIWSGNILSSDEAFCWLDRLGIMNVANLKTNQLSGGQQSRLGVATALASNAELILLDEPGAALDPIGRSILTEIYTTITDLGVGLVVSSHDVTDLTDFFKKVIVLHEGAVSFTGTPSAFLNNHHQSEATLKLANAFKKLRGI